MTTKTKQCENPDCGKKFKPKHWYQRFCSAACRLKDWRKKPQQQDARL